MIKNKNEFLESLAILCETYGASFSYSNDDSGIDAHINGTDRDLIELGFLDMFDAASDIRKLKDAKCTYVLGESSTEKIGSAFERAPLNT